MNPWSHLPNATLIDWVIQSVKSNQPIWDRAWDRARDAAYNVAWKTAWAVTRDAIRDMARDRARDAAYNVTWKETREAGVLAAWTTIGALIAYDDCDQYLNMTHEQLLIHAVLSEKPQAVLLLPLKWVQEQIGQSLRTAA